VLQSWASNFIFWPTYSISKTFLTIQPLIYHLLSSHAIPRSTTYPPGLPRHPSSLLASHSLLSYIIDCRPQAILSHSTLLESTINPLFAPIGNSIVLSLLFSIFSSDITTASLWKSHHPIVLPIRSGDPSLVYKSDHISRVGP